MVLYLLVKLVFVYVYVCRLLAELFLLLWRKMISDLSYIVKKRKPEKMAYSTDWGNRGVTKKGGLELL